MSTRSQRTLSAAWIALVLVAVPLLVWTVDARHNDRDALSRGNAQENR